MRADRMEAGAAGAPAYEIGEMRLQPHTRAREDGQLPGDYAAPLTHTPGRFQHETLLYAGAQEFLAGTLRFIEGGLERQEPVFVAVAPERLRLLRGALGAGAARVQFLDMHELGRNPARIIPAWQALLDSSDVDDQPLRGIAEPIWPGRSDPELCECERHESLLNLAFDGGRAWRLLCSYDVEGLDETVIQGAYRTHPLVVRDGASHVSNPYLPAHAAPGPFAGSVPAPSAPVEQRAFGVEDLGSIRDSLARWADGAALGSERTADLVLAVSELASNSVRHGGGEGILRIWREARALVCEVHDGGRIEQPLTGRIKPQPAQLRGRGLWLVNQVCDLVQIRSGDAGTVVRVRMARH
jgi:anti-sigma regulatory factor (Ser/Thr protein kinase)